MYSTILDFPNQFLFPWQDSNLRKNFQLKKIKTSSRIILAGMGGSSLPVDLVNQYLEKPLIWAHRDYGLPKWINPADIVICSSYSGNTEETIDAFYKAELNKNQIIVLTHGGKLKELALEKNVPIIEIPICIQPRCAAGYFFSSLLFILNVLGLVPSQQKILIQLKNFLNSQKKIQEKIGKELAESLVDRIPIIYSPNSLASVARIWKIKFNENAKIQSFYNIYPELNHNEMVGYSKLLMKPIIIQLKSQFMHPKVSHRMEVMEALLSSKIPFQNIILHGSSLIQEIFDAHAIADFSTYFLAEKYGIDPVPVEMVEGFKKQLN